MILSDENQFDATDVGTNTELYLAENQDSPTTIIKLTYEQRGFALMQPEAHRNGKMEKPNLWRK